MTEVIEKLRPEAVETLVKVLESDDENLRFDAACALARLKGGAPKAVPVLVKEVARGEARKAGALSALLWLDPHAVAQELRRVGNPGTARVVARLLAGWPTKEAVALLDEMGPEAVGELVKVMEGDDLLACFRAAHALSYSRLAGGKAVGVLVEELRGSGAAAQMNVLASLARIGPAAADALPQVLKAARHKQARVRWEAVRALGRIGPGRADVRAALKAALKDDHWKVRQAGKEAMEGRE